MDNKIIKNAINGSAWLIGTNVGSIILRLVSIAVLARILEPKLFGTFALLKIVYMVPTTISSSHLSKNIILLKDKKGILINAIYLAIIYSLIISITIIFFADTLSLFFNQSELKSLISSIFYLPLILNANTVIDAFFSKKLNFKKIAIRNFLSLFISVIITVILSLYDYGIWALIYGFIVAELMKLLLLIINLSFDSLKLDFNILKLLHKNYFSINGTQMLFQTVNNIDKTIISKYLSSSALGFYVKGVQVSKMPINLLGNSLQKVGFSTLVLKSDDNKFLSKTMLFGLEILIDILFPIALLLFIFSDLIINIILGDGWIQSVLILKIMSFYMFFSFIFKLFTTVLATIEEFNKIFVIQVINALIIISGSLMFINKGINGIALTLLLASIISCIISFLICIKKLETDLTNIIKCLSKGVISSLLLLFLVLYTDYLSSDNTQYIKIFFQFIIISFFCGRNIYLQKNKFKI